MNPVVLKRLNRNSSRLRYTFRCRTVRALINEEKKIDLQLFVFLEKNVVNNRLELYQSAIRVVAWEEGLLEPN